MSAPAAEPAPTTTVRQVALVGSPNAGKTTLFNALSGLRAKTANYPGVTVSRREATISLGGSPLLLVDLPGTYGLDPISPDEVVVADALYGRAPGVARPDALVVVADATSLERSLLLVAQLLEVGLPTLLVLSMLDEVAARRGAVDLDRLAAALGIPVIGIVGHRGVGVDAVRAALVDLDRWDRPVLAPPAQSSERVAWVDSIVASVLTPLAADTRTRRIDSVLLHPIAGVVVFLVVMALFFQSIFTLAAPVVDVLDRTVGSAAEGVRDGVGGLAGDLLADGVIGGVGGVVVFVPQILLLFLLLGVLERVGYLARAALLADRVMGRFGLEGRSFVSMLSSFACAVPGILSTRTIPDERHRLATMMAAPLMTCSARLPVFTLLVGAFVEDRTVLGPLHAQGLALFGLYALGAVSGLIYAAVLSRVALRGPQAPFLMELPPFRRPSLRSVLLHAWDGAWSFLRRAGTVILLTTLVLWGLLNLPRRSTPSGLDGPAAASYQMEHSIGGAVGRALEPVFAPLGFEWRTNVALLGSLAAREVFVSTLAVTAASQDEASLPARLRSLRDADGDPVFDGPTVAALLVFFVYALQCLSTVAVLRRESNSWRWPLLAVSSMFVLAYLAALAARLLTVALS